MRRQSMARLRLEDMPSTDNCGNSAFPVDKLYPVESAVENQP
jgi:hypothetical protein